VLAHVRYVAAGLFRQLPHRQLSVGERLKHAQALRIGEGPCHRRTPLPYSVQIANVDHAANIQQFAQGRKEMAGRDGPEQGPIGRFPQPCGGEFGAVTPGKWRRRAVPVRRSVGYDGAMEDGGDFGGGFGGGMGDPRGAGGAGGIGQGGFGAGGIGGLGPGQLQGLAGVLGLGGTQGHDARDQRGMRIGGRDARDVRTQTGRDANRDGGAEKLATIEIHGEGRLAAPNAVSEQATVSIDSAGLTLEIGSARPIRAGYRDISLITIQQATVLLVLGEGPDSMRFILERFGDRLGPMVRLLRELRLKQRLTDGLVKVPDDPAELVEFAWMPTTAPLGPGPDGPMAAASGVGQLVVQPWGFVVCPLDERLTWIHFRRASIATVKPGGPGDIVVDGDPGTLTLRGLGAAATRMHDTLAKLRDGAFADAAGFVDQLMTDAPFGVRQKASDLLVDGRPVRPGTFGDTGWPIVETAVLGEPTFAESYQSLCATAGAAAPRWIAMSPVDPGGKDPKIWFLIAMPGNLVALELVTAGAHATYFYRVMPRAQYRGEPPEQLGVAAEKAVRDISEALVDCRFLREPMALPANQLRLPKYLRYRLALAVLPSLAWARARFVARVAHRDPASWSAAVADLIRWHSTATDEAAEWHGRASQEMQVAAAGGDGGDEDSGDGGDAVDAPGEGGGEAAADPTGAGQPGGAATTKTRPSGTPG
jgi:hypothetical protein